MLRESQDLPPSPPGTLTELLAEASQEPEVCRSRPTFPLATIVVFFARFFFRKSFRRFPVFFTTSFSLRLDSHYIILLFGDWFLIAYVRVSVRFANDGLIPSRAKCARDSLLAQVDVALREVGKILHPQPLIYATRADMCALVASLPQGDPKATLERLGSEGVTLTSNIK